ncbi:hypothetical protein BGZ79_006846 [Entomortierella chlamydospora]|nr:hypothetical protein BGZ79_006846 [Entomortierella chlamydospora]
MVATISPNNSNSEHTLNTLRYADRVKELKADGSAKGPLQGQDTNSGQEEYMDDVEGYGDDGMAANVYDDGFLSSDGENVADVTIDLLEDEEFPDILGQEEMVGMNIYEHELEEPSRQAGHDSQGSNMQTHPNQQQQQQQHMLQHQQQQPLGSERLREPAKSKLSRDRERDPQQSLKGRKTDAFSRLPMPKSFQQQSASALSSSTPPSNIPGPQHHHTLSGASGRSNSTNASPPLGSKIREPKSSPSDVVMSSGGSDYISQKGGANASVASPSTIKQPSVSAKHGQTLSISSNNNGSVSTGSASGNNDPDNCHMASPTSPNATTSSGIDNGASASGNSNKNWTAADIADFLTEHRNHMRDCGEITKRETKLLANVTLGMSSPIHAQNTGYSNSRESFMKYLNELDEIVDEKLITIVAMSQKLKALRGLS